MILHTIYGKTNLTSGEILDLAPLRRRPAGPVTRRIKRSRMRREDKTWLLAITGWSIALLLLV